ncbi:MAG TPA: glycosyltransferase family 2 protein [Phnomibacter sp.]|nr:glycosyltransferase family 2 protein [Phnomibacter sp.]
MQGSPHIAIAILNYNGRKHLEHYLPSVVQTNYPNYSIWVIDNASTDDSIAFVQANYPQINITKNPVNGGFAEGYNMGLAHIDAPYVLLLNSDVAVDPCFLQPLVDTLESHPEMAMVQPKILADLQRTQFEYAGAGGGAMDALGYPFCRGRLFDTAEADAGQYNSEASIFWASGAAVLVRKKIYDELGGLYAYFFMHNEEIDLCWRALNKGYTIGYNGQSVVYHLGGGSLAKESPRKTYFNFRNNLVMVCRNMPLSRLIFVLPMRAGLDGVAFLQMLATGKLENATSIPKAWFSFLKWMVTPSAQKWPGNRKAFNGPGRFNGSIVWQYFVRGKKSTADFFE